MQIRKAQLDAFLACDPARLLSAIKNLVREDHAYVFDGLPEDLFDEMIGGGVRTARGYGISAPVDIATFVELMCEVGPEFHRHPVVQAILTDPALPPERKVAALLDRTPPNVWDDIAATLHSQTWFPELREPDPE